MIAGTSLDPEQLAALDRFMADVEALQAPGIARDIVAGLLASALYEPSARARWRRLYGAVRIMLAQTPEPARRADAFDRLEAFLAENADLDSDSADLETDTAKESR